jgi:hypothetical protein
LQQHWNTETFEEAKPNMIVNTRARRLIITDPLHILKRIRDRFLSGPFRIGVGHDQTEFCIDGVRDKYHFRQLSSIIHELPRCMIH